MFCVKFNNSNLLAAGSFDCSIKIYNIDKKSLFKNLSGHNDYIWTINWNHNYTKIASGSSDKTIRIYDI